MRKLPAGQECPPHTIRIVDVGTGSGCIVVALARELPQAEIHATDVSTAALEIARINAARHQLERRIHFLEADLLAGFEENFFDFIVSNPPSSGRRKKMKSSSKCASSSRAMQSLPAPLD